jgi:hypothetical protein
LEQDFAELSADSDGELFLAALMAGTGATKIVTVKGEFRFRLKSQQRSIFGVPQADLGDRVRVLTREGALVEIVKSDVRRIWHTDKAPLRNEEILITAAPDIDTTDRTVRKQLLEATQAAGFQRARVISEQVEPRAMTAEASW